MGQCSCMWGRLQKAHFMKISSVQCLFMVMPYMYSLYFSQNCRQPFRQPKKSLLVSSRPEMYSLATTVRMGRVAKQNSLLPISDHSFQYFLYPTDSLQTVHAPRQIRSNLPSVICLDWKITSLSWQFLCLIALARSILNNYASLPSSVTKEMREIRLRKCLLNASLNWLLKTGESSTSILSSNSSSGFCRSLIYSITFSFMSFLRPSSKEASMAFLIRLAFSLLSSLLARMSVTTPLAKQTKRTTMVSITKLTQRIQTQFLGVATPYPQVRPVCSDQKRAQTQTRPGPKVYIKSILPNPSDPLIQRKPCWQNSPFSQQQYVSIAQQMHAQMLVTKPMKKTNLKKSQIASEREWVSSLDLICLLISRRETTLTMRSSLIRSTCATGAKEAAIATTPIRSHQKYLLRQKRRTSSLFTRILPESSQLIRGRTAIMSITNKSSVTEQLTTKELIWAVSSQESQTMRAMGISTRLKQISRKMSMFQMRSGVESPRMTPPILSINRPHFLNRGSQGSSFPFCSGKSKSARI